MNNLRKGFYVFVIFAMAFTFNYVGISQAQAGSGTVTGRIVAGGNPVGMGDVGVDLRSQSMQMGAGTENNGTFQIGAVPPGTYELSTHINSNNLADYMDVTVENVQVLDNKTVNVGDIALVKATKTITGKITYKGSGAPVVGANVNVWQYDGQMNRNTTTNANGVYTVKVIGGRWGTYVSGGWDNQGQPIEVDWIYAGQNNDVQFADNNSAESQTVNFAVISASSRVKGKIVYANGSPAVNIGVDLWSPESGGSHANTDQNGAFNILTSAGTFELNAWFPPEMQKYSFPRQKVTIADDETKNLGTITLNEKNSKIKGTVKTKDGQGLGNVRVNAFGYGNQDGPGDWSETQTDNSGAFTLWVGAGRYGVEVQQDPQMPYVSSESTKEFDVSANQTISGVNFTMIEADVTINGRVVDTKGHLMQDFHGYAEVRENKEMMGPGGKNFFGGQINQGTFQVKVPSAQITDVIVTTWIEPSLDFSLQQEIELTLKANGTYNVELVLVENDAVVTGKVLDSQGNPVTDFEFGEVYVAGERGSWKNARIEPGTGNYRLSLKSGNYREFGVHVEGSNYINGPPEFQEGGIDIPAGTTVRNLEVKVADAFFSGTVLDPDGNKLPGFSWVFAHEEMNEEEFIGGKGSKDVIDSGTDVRGGKFSLGVVGGKTYFIGAGVPPEMEGNNWMPPEEVIVDIAAGQTKNITLQYKEADGTIKGRVLDADGNPVQMGYVGGWSENGANTGTPVFGGQFSLPVTSDDVWHVFADTFNGTDYFTSGDIALQTPSGKNFVINRDFMVEKSEFRFPEPICETWDSTSPKTISLSDGAVLQFPASALATEGNVTVCAQPTVNIKPEKAKKLVKGFGYSLTATDADNQAITQFNSPVTVSFPVESELLAKSGLVPEDLLPAFYNTTSGVLESITQASYDEENDVIVFTVTHFTDFTIVTGSTSTTATATTANSLVVVPKAGGGPHIQMYDSNLDYLGGFMAFAPNFRGGVNAISADLNGSGTDELAVVPASNGGPQLRVLNTAGVELASDYVVAPSFRGGLNIDSGDVDGDSVNEIVISVDSGGGPQVIVYEFDGAALTREAVFFAYGENLRTGLQLAVGDVNGDGVDEIITAPNAGAGPQVRVFDGSGTAISSFFAYPSHLHNGVNLSLADVDADGTLDIITAPGAGVPANVAAWQYDSALITSFYALPLTNTVGVEAQAADVDGDGNIEIITTANTGGGPQVSIFDDQGTVEKRFFAYQETIRTGVTVAIADIDSDGTVDIITAPGVGGGPLVSQFDSAGTVSKRFFSHPEAYRGGLELILSNR
ncbi:MAG: FG-GAP-like repeat-containing protein [Patescibacteria group bacterium]